MRRPLNDQHQTPKVPFSDSIRFHTVSILNVSQRTFAADSRGEMTKELTQVACSFDEQVSWKTLDFHFLQVQGSLDQGLRPTNLTNSHNACYPSKNGRSSPLGVLFQAAYEFDIIPNCQEQPNQWIYERPAINSSPHRAPHPVRTPSEQLFAGRVVGQGHSVDGGAHVWYVQIRSVKLVSRLRLEAIALRLEAIAIRC